MWIKICGIRDTATARFLADLGVDALGLNFYAPSPRSVTIEQAAEIANAVRGRVTLVGLFVNHSVAEVQRAIDEVGLEMLQFHGDEPPEFLAEFPEFRIVRAFRMGPEGLAPVADYLRRGRSLNALPWACLIDAATPGQFGGTGTIADWQELADNFHGGWPPLILAGGLTPVNVESAIKATHPWGVDVASGVEISKAVKDRDLITQFVTAARRCLPG
ncbi:MAG: phosphoribosylanthranilate isomerase [Planctomycetota bacterium]